MVLENEFLLAINFIADILEGNTLLSDPVCGTRLR